MKIITLDQTPFSVFCYPCSLIAGDEAEGAIDKITPQTNSESAPSILAMEGKDGGTTRMLKTKVKINIDLRMTGIIYLKSGRIGYIAGKALESRGTNSK